MKKIISKHFPFAGYKAMTVWPFVFIRNSMAWAYNERTDRHEHIHGRQQLEMLAVGTVIAAVLFLFGCGWWSLAALPLFLYWYGVEWLIRWACYRNRDTAYKNISFEREAYDNEWNIIYLDDRKMFAWIWYLTKSHLTLKKI